MKDISVIILVKELVACAIPKTSKLKTYGTKLLFCVLLCIIIIRGLSSNYQVEIMKLCDTKSTIVTFLIIPKTCIAQLVWRLHYGLYDQGSILAGITILFDAMSREPHAPHSLLFNGYWGFFPPACEVARL
jgi:hypothetical protein